MKKLISIMLLMIAPLDAVFADKVSIYTQNAPAPIGVYSQAIKIGNTVYISGQIPIDPSTNKIVEGDFKLQFKQALANVSAIAQAAGGNLDDLVNVTIYLTDLKNFSVVNDVMQESFHQPYPARAVLEIKALPKDATVEIVSMMQLSAEQSAGKIKN